MFRDGFVSRIENDDVYRKIASDLRGSGYEFHEINCQFDNQRDLEDSLRLAFRLKPGIGLDAFSSQLADFEFPDCTGFAVALKNAAEFNRRFKNYFWNVIDVMVRESRLRILFGQRLLTIIHSHNESVEIEPVGAIRVPKCFLKSTTLGR